MTTLNSFNKSGFQSFAVAGNWNQNRIPISTDDAEINDNAIVTSSASELVNSIGTGSGNVLHINNNTIFEVNDGTGPDQNSGVISIFQAGLWFTAGGTFKNPGTIELTGDNAADLAALNVLGNTDTTLSGGGTVVMSIGGGPNANQIFGENGNQQTTLINADNTISGDGTIGGDLAFVNHGTVETNNNTSSSGGTLVIQGSAGFFFGNRFSNGSFTNDGLVRADNGGTLVFGVDGASDTVDNEGSINIDNTTAATTALEIAGNVTITATGEGSINLMAGSGAFGNKIFSDGNPATLTLVNQTIKGAGVVGDHDLTLDNQSGTIEAVGGTLFLYTEVGPTAIINGGTLEAVTPGGTLLIQQPVNNAGMILAANGGQVSLTQPISGSGAVDIGAGGSITLSFLAQIAGNVTFTGGGGLLTLLTTLANGGIGGEIVGAAASDQIDLLSDAGAYSATNHLSWQQTGANGGVLSLINSSGTVLVSLNLAGSYTSANFSMSGDAFSPPEQGTLITLLNPPSPAGTTADMIMDQNGTGNYEIYDLGNNAIVAAYSAGNVGSQWQVAGLGAFDGTDTSDMLMRDSSTGALQICDVASNTIVNAVAIGQVGLGWVVAGFGDFSGQANETDMLMRNSSTGQFEVYDIGNNQITNAMSMGQVGTAWQVAGFGDFSGHAGETGDMLMRNTSTGQFEVYDISNNAITNATSMGQVGLEWQAAGFGDFSGNANETDMLMRNSNTGAFEIYDISNNAIYNAAPMGQVGLEWQVAGFGPINGAGTSDMLMRNTNTGAFEIYDITNNQITTAASMGQVGLDWPVTGIAADPPGSAAAAGAQLAQAMAGYAPSADALVTMPPPGQPVMQSAPAAVSAAPDGQNQPFG